MEDIILFTVDRAREREERPNLGASTVNVIFLYLYIVCRGFLWSGVDVQFSVQPILRSETALEGLSGCLYGGFSGGLVGRGRRGERPQPARQSSPGL